jgi:hypothetical protein
VDYPFIWKYFSYLEVADYPPLNWYCSYLVLVFAILLSLIVFVKISRVQEINMADSHESKLNAILKTIEALTVRTRALENLALRDGTSPGAEIPQSMQHVAVEGPVPLPSQGNNCSNQILDGDATKYREPRVSHLEKFNATLSKFRGFVNQVWLTTTLQPECYPTEQSQVGLVGTLLTEQALSWYAPLLERRALVLNNFEAFLAAFAKAFKDHDKAHSTTIKIFVLRLRTRPASVYALDFILLACDINWDEEALLSQFHWGLRDNVKDLLLSRPNRQTLNEAISQAVKCDNRLFQRRQDQHS